MPVTGRLHRRHGYGEPPCRDQDGQNAERRLWRHGNKHRGAGGTPMKTHPPPPDPNDPQANPMLAPGVQAINMSKRFGSLVALDNVSMTVRPGSFHALLGGNGAGKSTLVKCIMGYYQPDSGDIVVGQRKEEIKNPKEALALGI